MPHLPRSNSPYAYLDRDACVDKCSRSIATVLNTLGARLLHATNNISSSMLASHFMEGIQNEAGSTKPEKAIYCVLHQQDEFPHFQHHHKLFGFPFSQHTCPRETQLVVSLFRPSLLGPLRDVLEPAATSIEPMVSMLCHKTHDRNLHCVPISPRWTRLRKIGA